MSPTKSTLTILAGLAVAASAGPKLSWDDGARTLEIQQVYQFWGAYTYDPYSVPEHDARLDFLVRRARWTFKGQAAPDIAYQFGVAYDGLGKDPLTTGVGGTAAPSTPSSVQVIDAYATWTVDTTWANLTVGLFKPVTSREIISAFTNLPSLDNSPTYGYVRDALFTRSTAREAGANLGGSLADTSHALSATWDLGVFDASQEKLASGSVTGSGKWAPLFTGRASATWGDPETKAYSIARPGESYGKRKGITAGFFATWQGETDVKFDTTWAVNVIRNKANTKDSVFAQTRTVKYAGGFAENKVVGGDLQAEWSGWVLNAEYDWMYRRFDAADRKRDTVRIPGLDYSDAAWHVRLAYGIDVAKVRVEPSGMYGSYDADAKSVLNPGGEESVLDLGVDTYLHKQSVRVGLHWVHEDGKAKSGYTQGAGSTGKYSQKDDAYVASLQLSF
jgi:hypothetical protein